MYRKLFCLVVFLISVALAGYYDSGTQTFTQPNSVTFQARIYGDGADTHFRTSNDYEVKRGSDLYYYYAILDSASNLTTTSEFKVGIDTPPSSSYQLEYLDKSSGENQGASYAPSASSPNGDYKIGIVLVEFSDKKHYEDSNGDGYSISDYETMLFSDDNSWNTDSTNATNPEGRDVFGSLREYYDFQTKGNVTFNDSSGVILAPNDSLWHELNYSFYDYELRDIVSELNLGGSYYDGYDKICIIHAGDIEYGTDLSPRANCPGRYWIAGERNGYGYQQMGFTHSGIHAHEFGHTIGLEHTGHTEWNTEIMDSTAKYWDVMLNGNVNGPDKDGACPASMNPVYKLWHGWFDTSDTVHITHDTSSLSVEYDYNSPKYYIVNKNGGRTNGEYFILENRLREGWDEYTPIRPDYTAQSDDVNGNQGGLLILRVKEISSTVLWATNINADDKFADPYCVEGPEYDYNLYKHYYCRAPFPLLQNQSINDYSTPNTNFYDISSLYYTITDERKSNYAFHNIEWDDSSKIVTLDIITNFDNSWSGNLTTNTEWTGTVTVEDNLTITSGADLTIASGTTVNVASGKRIYVNGDLTASGVTFTSSGTWNGIKYNSGSTGSLTNCTISKVTTGIYLDESDRTIDNCTITTAGNSTNYGIYIDEAHPTIKNCDITGTDFLNTTVTSYGIYCYDHDSQVATIEDNEIGATYGIYCYDASPDIQENDVTTHMYGLYCTNSSSPKLVWQEQSVDGDNYFHGTFVDIGVVAVYSSNPILGSQNCGLEYYGNNSFVFSMVDDRLVSAGTNCSVKAEHCWWGSSSPSSSLFYGSVDYQPCLTSMPTYSMPIISPESDAFTHILLSSTIPTEEVSIDFTLYYNEEWPIEKKVDFLRYLYMLGEAKGVADLCKDIIKDNPGTPESFYVLDLMYQIARDDDIKKDFNKDLFKTYIKSLKYGKSMDLLKSRADLMLAGIEDDMELIDKVYKKNKNTYLGKYALEQKFMHYIHEDDINNAREVLNLMDEVYPNEEVTYQAHLRIGDKADRSLLASEQLGSNEIDEIILEEYSLEAAYPNPFNPSMTLEYNLPIQSEVECSIFDVCGKMVKEFFFNQYTGTHSITWNADQFSSGIYIIRFTANAVDGAESFVDYQKVTLLK